MGRRGSGTEQETFAVRFGTVAGVLLITTVAALAAVAGVLRPLDDSLAQVRFDLLQRSPSRTLTVVEIDVDSLRAAGTWPWSRSRFARAIDNLADAGAEVVSLDVDFSAPSSPEADAALASAVRRHPGQVVLATFVQAAGQGAAQRQVESHPIRAATDEAVLASVNVPVDSDGRVRRYNPSFPERGGERPALAATLAGQAPGSGGAFLIDYGIRARDIDRLSFEAVYSGRFDPALVRGRKVLVGATALELGDEFATPMRGILQGVYVHALAYESLVAGRALREPALPIVVALAGLVAFLLRPREQRNYASTLRRHLLVAVVTLGAPIALQAWLPVSLDASPVLLAQGLCLLWSVRNELNRRARAVVEAREAHLVQLADHMRESRDSIRAAHDELQVVNAALDRALKARTDFLAMTSHEIRTPLNGIMGMTQVILADRSLADGLREKLRIVHSSGETMLALVDDLLDVAKMESGALTISPVQMNLHALLGETVKLWGDKAEGKGLMLRADHGDVPALIVEDQGRLRQILSNLLANAIKFTEAGKVALTVRVETGAAGETLAFEVADTGIGIPEDKLEKIFEAFSQVDDSISRKFGGTGLGLAIVRRLARAMGGDLSVTSELGVGSCFTVRLPLRRAGARADATGGARGPSQRTVLLVEANPLAQSVMKAALGGEVAALEFAASAEEAIALLAVQRFDLLLVEGKVLASGPSGPVAALGHLADVAAGAAVVVLWAGGPDEAASLEAAGAWVVRKPIGTADLVRRLDAIAEPRDRASAAPRSAAAP